MAEEGLRIEMGRGVRGRQLKESPEAAAWVMSARDENREGSPANPQLQRG